MFQKAKEDAARAAAKQKEIMEVNRQIRDARERRLAREKEKADAEKDITSLTELAKSAGQSEGGRSSRDPPRGKSPKTLIC